MFPPPAPADALLPAWGVRDAARGARILQGLAKHLGPAFDDLLPHLGRLLPQSPDPDLALNALERFFVHPSARDLLPALLADDARKLRDVVHLFGTSQFLGDVLAADPDFLETATAPLRVTPTREELVELLRGETAGGDDAAVLRAVRRFRRRQQLRVGGNDI